MSSPVRPSSCAWSHALGEGFQERNVVLVGHGARACVGTDLVVAADGVVVAGGVASYEELSPQSRIFFLQLNDVGTAFP